MKITNLKTGIPYQLKQGTQLEVERTNPFFNEYGEQTLPLEIPDTDQNRIALGYPDQLGSNKKQADVSALIEDGDYYAVCKQAILSAKRNESISTSFYMNQGSFYSSLQKTDLKTIFEGETIPGVSTVEEGINFCRSLRSNKHEHFAIFPVLIKDDSGSDNEDGTKKYKYINRWGHWNPMVNEFTDGSSPTAPSDFYNAVSVTELVDGEDIAVPPGYFISPFIRVNYVLMRIFLHFGYILKDNFFFKTYPFTDMVFINNVADTLVNGDILTSQLVPDVKCNDIINLFRHKFCCEFIANEVDKTVSIVLFTEILTSTPELDLTRNMDGNYSIEYPEKYKQIKLSPKFETDHEVTEVFESLSDLISKYPLAYFSKHSGSFVKNGFRAGLISNIKLTEACVPYYAGGSYEVQEIEIEECIPDFRLVGFLYLYIGDYQMINSKLMKSSQGKDEETSSDNKGLHPMLAFPFINEFGDASGSITNYEAHEELWEQYGIRFSDYSLCYYGEDGIFEKFYRPLDTLFRNSLHTIRTKLLLSNNQKRDSPAYNKYILCNQEVLFNKLSFQIGGDTTPMESELFTLKLYEPITSSPHLSEIMADWDTEYYWAPGMINEKITEEEYNTLPYPKIDVINSSTILSITLYPPPPTPDDFGKERCHEQKYLLKSSTQGYRMVTNYVCAIKRI